MADPDPAPVLRHAEEIEYEPVELADGLSKGVLLGEAQETPTFAMRRFELAPGATVPRHTNAREHEQYVLEGTYTVGIGDETHAVSPGDALLIPAGVEHWYRNDGDAPGAFLCLVPNGVGEIHLADRPSKAESTESERSRDSGS